MLGSLSITHWMIFICVAAVLFGGKGKISSIMGDIGKGFGDLRRGLSDTTEAKEQVEAELKKALPKSRTDD